MVGASRGVLGDPAAELGEHQRRYPAVDPTRREVGLEGAEALRQLHQLGILVRDLVAVRVERAPVDRDDAGPEVRREQNAANCSCRPGPSRPGSRFRRWRVPSGWVCLHDGRGQLIGLQRPRALGVARRRVAPATPIMSSFASTALGSPPRDPPPPAIQREPARRQGLDRADRRLTLR